jgi:hypothetical protein
VYCTVTRTVTARHPSSPPVQSMEASCRVRLAGLPAFPGSHRSTAGWPIGTSRGSAARTAGTTTGRLPAQLAADLETLFSRPGEARTASDVLNLTTL